MTIPTKLDNRVRIEPRLWKAFLDKCANEGIPYKVQLEALIAAHLRGVVVQKTSQEHFVPTQIPEISHTDPFLDQLLDGDLFS